MNDIEPDIWDSIYRRDISKTFLQALFGLIITILGAAGIFIHLPGSGWILGVGLILLLSTFLS